MSKLNKLKTKAGQTSLENYLSTADPRPTKQCTPPSAERPSHKKAFVMSNEEQTSIDVSDIKALMDTMEECLYMSGMVNSNTVNLKFHLVQSFYKYLARISCL